ncbi:MAG: helix-turn-helix transcriptional regulator [Chitinophaga sp.]|uniref:helix-turn-helix domain-containing protein n=1 Tax=Chitinophaga sp. TaxID=1869181 RepID=UPI0025C5DA71|nr:AraC family transcriptional regulator [Chitinophaga sp.]MBV8255278.1 helix-turn-helix transcriptional regulator [Chitinophaga sp.]
MAFTKIIDQAEVVIVQMGTEVYKFRSDYYFEMAFVLEGSGLHTDQKYNYRYGPRKLFLLQQGVQYTFEPENNSSIAFLRFSPGFIDQVRFENERIETCDNLKKIGYILHHFHAKAGCIFREKVDEKTAHVLLEGIIREYQQKSYGHVLIIRQSLSILINLIARNLIASEGPGVNTGSDQPAGMRLITYIQQHITDPVALKTEVMAEKLNISPHYLGEYFKKHTGRNIQDYLVEYRMKLIETRLVYSNMRLKEIASELAFNDESYLTKYFRKYKGMTPGAYRKRYRNINQ